MTDGRLSLQVISEELAALQDQFARREYDVAFESNEGEVFYGIDNDVITAMTAPWSEGNASIFGPLFTDWPDSPRAFATVFTEFVQNGKRRAPFFLIPPGHNELEGIWNEVYLQAIDTFATVDEHFSRLLDGSEELRIDAPGSEAQLFETVSRAVNIIYGGVSPTTELRRITRLSQSGAIRRVDSYVGPDGYSPFTFPEADETSNFQEKERKWRRLLDFVRKERAGSNPNDAAVLAFVEFANEVFERKDQRCRLCYVTGDSHIYRIAADVVTSSGESFSRAFLRRPTAFLADANFFVGAGLPVPELKINNKTTLLDSKVSIAEWLREIFTIHVEHRMVSSKGYSAQLLDAMREARLKWGAYLKSTSASLSISPEEIESAIDFHSKAARYLHRPEVLEDFSALRRRIGVVTVEAKLGFGVAGALSRFWSIRPSERESGVRGIPRVRFDSFKTADTLAKTLSEKDGLSRTQIQLSKAWLLELRREDPSGYTTMIVFALAFGSVAEWGTALKVAELAYSIARTQRELRANTTVKGDEAAYLCAVFTRLTARSIGDLSGCGDWLDQAETLRRSPPLRRDLDPKSDRADDRFVAERLALRLTRRLLGHFVPDQGDSQVSRALVESLDSFDKLLESHLTELRFIRARGAYSTKDYYWQQLLINGLQCLIFASQERLPSQVIAEMRGYLEEFIDCQIRDVTIDSLNALSHRLNSKFTFFVLLSALLILFPEDVPASRQAEFLARLEDLGGQQTVFPYDSARAATFVHRARESIQEH